MAFLQKMQIFFRLTALHYSCFFNLHILAMCNMKLYKVDAKIFPARRKIYAFQRKKLTSPGAPPTKLNTRPTVDSF